MAEAKKHMNRHLRSARQWLSKAEEAFDKDHNVRGELDLLLAQAELQHAKEKKTPRRWTLGNPLLRHGLALGLAVFVATMGLGGAYWFLHEQKRAVPIPLAQEEHPVKTAQPISAFPVPVQASQQPLVTEHRPAESSPAANAAVDIVKPLAIKAREITILPKAEEADTQLPPAEMHKLLRAATKSLRGQE